MSPLSDNARNAYWRIRGFPVPPLVLLGHRDSIWSVACLPDGERVISGSEDGSVRTWRAQDGRGVGKVMNQGGWVFAVAISSDGQWIATAGEDAKIIIWNARTQEKVVEWEGHSSSVWTLGFSVDSARLVSGSRDGSVVVWSTTTGERLVGPLTGHTGWVFCASFSPQGDEIASCDSRDVRIWNSHSPKAVRDRHFPRGQPFFGELVIPPVKVKAISLAWTPNGLLITGCYDGSIKQFDSSTGSLLAEWKSHVGIIRSIAVSPNGKFIASGSPDHTVRLWDTTTRQQIGPVLQHDDAVHSVAISPDGSHLLSGGLGGKARIWSLKGFISQSLLENAPTTSSDAPVDNIAGGHPSKGVKLVIQKPPGSPSIKPNPLDIVQEEAVSSAEGHSSDPPSPPKIRKRIRSVKVKTSNLEHSTQVTAWNLDYIRSRFSNDLTGSVVQEGEDPFASGSYGDIYKGTLRVSANSIEVAVKAIRTYSADDDDHAHKKKKLRREIRVWLNLKHINVLPLFGTTMGFGRFPAMVCPWLKDGTLSSYLERWDDSLTTGQRLVLLGDVAAGLQYLHSRSVVHGDLSGSNVLIHGNGRACIADFGLSTLLTELGGSTFATSFQARGTLRWAAPELLDLEIPENDDNPPKVFPTPESDVYSFGGIMLQVLSGKVPYHYYSREAQVVHAVSKGETPKRPSGELTTDARWNFIERCWASVDSRPSDEEIVEFTRHELVEIVLPHF